LLLQAVAHFMTRPSAGMGGGIARDDPSSQ
jgi:hypothetical protein